MKRPFCLFAALTLSLGLALTAAADEISDQIGQGLKLYQQGKISQALGELEFAVAQLKQKKAEALATLLPAAPSGWQADKGQGKSLGGGFMGGGISASRTYQNNKGGRVQIEIVTDSPLIQSLAMLLGNPMFAQGGGQNKLLRLKGHKAFLKQEGAQGAELQTLVNNKVLVKVSARRVPEAEQAVRQFAELMDLDKISQLAR
ncbi:MAG: hypothetical protein C4525_08380 [Desulfarculus sp.]|nr:MAG: hypothetical protein C4525_08380 [Desulfarculus sp.]